MSQSIPRLAVVVSHPIQHFVHLYRALAKVDGLAFRVFFCSRIGLEPYHDPDMGQTIRWAGDLTGGYDHEFLPEADAIRDSAFWHINNPSVGAALDVFAPDVVVVYGYSQVTPLRVLAWCRRRRIPTLMICDNEEVHRRPWKRDLVRRAAMPLVLRQYAGFLTVGDHNEAFYSAHGIPRSRLFRSPFPIDETTYLRVRADRAKVRKTIRASLGLPDGAFVFVTVGKLTARKRPLDALAALAHIATSAPNCHFVFCGDGAERPVMEARVQREHLPVTFAGFVNVDRLPDFYAAADAFVLMSEHDPHPLVCIEAAAIGLPMILSDRIGAIGPSDIARPEQNALVFSCGDSASLAGCMERLLRDEALTRRMAEASARIYGECDMAASVAGVLEAVSANVLSASPRPGA